MFAEFVIFTAYHSDTHTYTDMRTNYRKFREENKNNNNLQRDDGRVNVWCSSIQGWENIKVTPLSGPCKGGTQISGTFTATVGTPSQVVFADSWSDKDPQTCKREKGTKTYSWTSPSSFKSLCEDSSKSIPMLLEYRARNSTNKKCKLPDFEFQQAPNIVWIWILTGILAGILIGVGIVVSCLWYRKKIANQQQEIDENDQVVNKLIGDKDHLVSKSKIKNINRSPVGSGNYGTVYKSGNYACKVLKRDGDFLGEVGINPELSRVTTHVEPTQRPTRIRRDFFDAKLFYQILTRRVEWLEIFHIL